MALTKIKLNTGMVSGSLPDANIPNDITISGAQTGITQVGTLTSLTTSGVVLGANGSDSAPSFSFSSDTNTGIYRGAEDTLRISTGGTERFEIGNTQAKITGNFITTGTLDVRGTGSSIITGNYLYLDSADNSNAKNLVFRKLDDTWLGQIEFHPTQTAQIVTRVNTALALGVNNSQKMTIGTDGNTTFAGNVGIKNTAFESWHSNWDGVLQIGETTSLGNYGGTDTYLLENAYHDGSWKYQTTSHASKLTNQGGSYVFSVADSGSADATITWKDAFTINNNGNSIFSGDYKVGIGQGSPTNSPLEVNLTQSNGTVGSSGFAHFGSSGTTDGHIQGISLGYRESNANYRKIAIAVRGRGDGATRSDLCFLVDTANDQASATLQDSKLTIDGLTGNANFSNDIMRFHNDYTNRVYSGYTTGNAGFSVTFPIQDNSSLLITAIFTHYGAGIASYGCARMAWLSCRDNSQDPQNISSITSSNGGSWSISTSGSVVTVSKVAGSYSGGGHYWVKIEGSANV